MSGIGGAAGDCETATPEGTCSELAAGWFAVKLAFDVWWQGSRVHDPGRGDITFVFLARAGEVCAGEGEPTAELKLCDVEMPVITTDVRCEAYELSFADATWDSPGMPRFVTTMEGALSAGGMFSLSPWMGLLGLDLLDPAGELPMLGQWDSTSCADGDGVDCYPDHDQDMRPGIKLIARNDGADYVGPYDDGLCSNKQPYRLVGLPFPGNIVPKAGPGYTLRATEVHAGMRARASVAASIASDCASATGNASDTTFELRAGGCDLDPMTLLEPDPRVGMADPICDELETMFLDEAWPTYRVLLTDEVPGASMVPLGWGLIERDIPMTASVGPRTAFVHIADLTQAEPSCSTVRATVFPDDAVSP